ncbi:MAG: Plug domain-containing protein, partial [candidate division WOR-3 bacterium]
MRGCDEIHPPAFYTTSFLFASPPSYEHPFTNIYVFNFDEIENLPITNLDELLMLIPGVVKDYSTIHIWGSNGKSEIVYYLDGIPVTNPYLVDLNIIEKISIQKSGFSAEYGNGFGGMVHIATKKIDKNSLRIAYLTDDFLLAERL